MIYGIINNNNCFAESVSLLELTKGCLQTTSGLKKLVILPVVRTLGWIEWAQGCLSTSGAKVKESFNKSFHLLEGLDFPKNVSKLASTSQEFFTMLFTNPSIDEITSKSFDVLAALSSPTGYATGTIKMIEKEGVFALTPLQLQWMSVLGFVGSLGLFVDTARGISADLQEMGMEGGQLPLKMAKLISKISLLVIAMFGMVTFAYGANMVPQVATLIAATTLLVSGIVSHFLTEIGEKKVSFF